MIAILAISTFLVSCTKEVEVVTEKLVFVDKNFDQTKGVVNLKINHTVNGNPFEINKSFTDASGNTFNFKELRYWISNVQFIKANGESVKIPDSYYLVENRDSLFFYGTTTSAASKSFSLPKKREEILIGNVPAGDYTKVKFAIGVDPTYNDNFALKAGELDINQMAQVASWAWQTSYIFLRTKGVFLAKGADPLTGAVRFVAETGSNDMYREVEMALPTTLMAKAGQVSNISLTNDVISLFEGLNVTAFKGTKPSGWAADPNLSKFDKFLNAGSLDDMKKMSDNAKSAFVKKAAVTQ
ncbi:MAG: MbnP family protein [Emticicia sp.]|nr:MbnP family protein [Emticicia sp.]